MADWQQEVLSDGQGIFTDISQHFANHIVGADAFRLSFKIQNHTVAQDWHCHGFEIFACHMVTMIQNRSNLRAQDQGLKATGAGPIANIFSSGG
jgi:hypothetical protein